MGYLPAKKAGEMLELNHLETIRRIRRGQIKAKKFGGWYWVVAEEEVERVRKTDWHKRLMDLRARRASA